MAKYEVTGDALEKLDGVAVQSGDVVELRGRAARTLEAAGHIVLLEADASDLPEVLEESPRTGGRVSDDESEPPMEGTARKRGGRKTVAKRGRKRSAE